MKKALLIVAPLTDYEDSQENSGPDFEKNRLVSPIDAITTATILRDRDIKVELFDLGIYGGFREKRDQFSKFAANNKFDFFVLVPPILTFATAADFYGLDFIKIAEKYWGNNSFVKIITGTVPTNYPGKCISKGFYDYEIIGEFDFLVPDLIDSLINGKDMPKNQSLISKENVEDFIDKGNRETPYPRIDVKKLPVPDYNLISKEQKHAYSTISEKGKIRFPEKSSSYRDIMTSRGCTLRCSFCSVAHFRGPTNAYRRKSVKQVINEVKTALDDGIQEIHFFDDLFAENKDQIFEFCNTLQRYNLKFPWFVAQGLNLWFLDYEVLKMMKDCGMYRVIAPFESGSNRVLKKIVGKIHSTTDKHIEVIKACEQLNLELIGMFVIGMPGETRKEIYETVMFAQNNPSIDYSVFSIATPMVGTRLANKVKSGTSNNQTKNLNKIIKRTVLLYETTEFSPLEIGLIRGYDWKKINFSTEERKLKYSKMVGVTVTELDQLIEHSIKTFQTFFPDYEGPKSFIDLFEQGKIISNRSAIVS